MPLVQPLRPYMNFVTSEGKLTKEAYDFLYMLFLRVGGSLPPSPTNPGDLYPPEEPSDTPVDELPP